MFVFAAAQPLKRVEESDEQSRFNYNYNRRHSAPGSALRRDSNKQDEHYIDQYTGRKMSHISQRSSRPSSRRGSAYSEHHHHHHSRRGSQQIDKTDHNLRSSKRGLLFPAHLEEDAHDSEANSSLTNSSKNVKVDENGFV